ncbi:MAG: glycosyltransferase family A protein [Syntrophorhabdales bacterium]|jgi:glycosyltransferase involved in cell wall biosynthesis
MHHSSVTVIVPVYNAAFTLARCLDSVFNQSLIPNQVILINDGSTDDSRNVAESYKDRIEYIEQTNQGPGAARNAGLKAAKGGYVAFLDADDYWLPEFLTRCVQFLDRHSEVVAVTTGQSIKLWGHPAVVRPKLLEEFDCPTEPFVIDNFFLFWAHYDHVVTGASLLRRKVIEKAGYQRTDFRVCEDLEYWGYLATYGPWGFIPKVLWVSDPTRADASQGWMKKHKKRWENLPSVEDWESRIRPRLRHENVEGFEIVKSRVAASLVHQNILAGNLQNARAIFRTLKGRQRQNLIIRLLDIGNMAGSFGWFAMCKLIQCRERVKAIGIYLSTMRQL